MREPEMVAYSLQAYGRAVVVGETAVTEGWGHFREERFEIGEQVFGKGWWSMYVQTLRIVHEATGADWDRVGVKSDVVVNETIVEEHCHHKAILAAIEFEKEKIERNKGFERQDELRF
jgi:C-terminal processing protease CtpA/Prc